MLYGRHIELGQYYIVKQYIYSESMNILNKSKESWKTAGEIVYINSINYVVVFIYVYSVNKY